MQNYQDWIRLVAELTVNSLNAWHWSGSSVYYLLGLWSRLVSSMPYLKGDSPSQLDTFVPKISRAYINSRSVHANSALLSQSLRQTARLSSVDPSTEGAISFPSALKHRAALHHCCGQGAPHAAKCSLPALWQSASLQMNSSAIPPASDLHRASACNFDLLRTLHCSLTLPPWC